MQTPDFTLQNDTSGNEHGEHLTKAQLRANILRDWSVIAENRAIAIEIDSLTLQGDTAIVYTRQHYERLMHQPQGPILDTIVISGKHREIWHHLPQGWRVAPHRGAGARANSGQRPGLHAVSESYVP